MSRTQGYDDPVPIQDVKIEMQVLGCIMLEPEYAYPVAADILTRDDFYLDGHGIIFDLMGELYRQGVMPDSLILVEELRLRELLPKVGGAAFVICMVTEVMSGQYVDSYAHKVAELAYRRRIARGCVRIAQDAHDLTNSTDKLAKMLLEMGTISTGRLIEVSNAEAAADRLHNEALQYQDERKMRGCSTGFPKLDELTGGYRGGHLWVNIGRANFGKSRLSCYSASAAARDGAVVAYSAIEMGRDIDRYLLSSASGVMGFAVNSNVWVEPWKFHNADDLLRLSRHHAGKLGSGLLPVYAGVDSVPAVRRFLRQRRDVTVLFVDQAQSMAEYEQAPNVNEERRAARRMLTGLKSAAVEFDICIVLNHQTSRDGAYRPKLTNAADSDAYARVPDFVVGFHDPTRSLVDEFGGYVWRDGMPVAPPKNADPGSIVTKWEHERPILLDLLKTRWREQGGESINFNFSTGMVRP